MAQLWVNLPAKHKMDPPGYQPILKNQIPEVSAPRRTSLYVPLQRARQGLRLTDPAARFLRSP